MVRLSGGLGNKSVQRHITFGVSKLWIPHVALVYFIYYVLLSPHQYYADHQFWALGAYIRVLVGRKVVNGAVAFTWIVHVFEAAYTVVLARRYETSFVVGLSYVLATLIFGRPGWEELSNRAQGSPARSKIV